MKKICVDGFRRISKKEAEKRYNRGETIRFCAVKLSPVNLWGMFADLCNYELRPLASDGFNTTVPRNRAFETAVQAFQYYNCNAETGKYPAYYVKEV